MLKVNVYNMQGKVVGEENLPETVFDIEAKSTLIHQVVVAQAANARQVLAHAKKRDEVSGGGKKPWKQKGTGRARQGSSRSPQWRGGGVVFGPSRERNFSQKINKKMKRLALLASLTNKFRGSKLVVVDNFEIGEAKTKQLAATLKVLPTQGRKTLFALSAKQGAVTRAAQNISSLKVIGTKSLNVLDIIKYPYLLTTRQGLKEIAATYGPTKE